VCSSDLKYRDGLEKAIADAITFVEMLPCEAPDPFVSRAEDGEVVLEWWNHAIVGFNAVVGFDGDGTYGYAIYKSRWEPGHYEGKVTSPIPKDLLDALLKEKTEK
jgi:hypothetical protein